MTGEPQNVTLQDGLPVMCLLLANEQDMWCGCGNMIFVLNAQYVMSMQLLRTRYT